MNAQSRWTGDKEGKVPLDGSSAVRRVLLAEDDDQLRQQLAGRLRYDGFEVIEVKNAKDLLEQISLLLANSPALAPIDVIITDVQTPGFTGLAILTELAELRRRPTVIVITAGSDPSARARAHHIGARVIMNKPFDIDDLRTVVMNVP